MRVIATAIFCLAVMAGPLTAQAVKPGTALFMGLHWIDLSTEGQMNGTRADESARLAMVTQQVEDELTARGFSLTNVDPEKVSGVADPGDCNGCDTHLARDQGLDYAISGQVQKVSNLILALRLSIRDAESGKAVAAGTVDIRGNTDESWSRGFTYLFKNVLFRTE